MQKTDAQVEPGGVDAGKKGGPGRSRGRRLAVWLYRRIRGLLALGMLLLIALIVTPVAGWLQDALDVTQRPQMADYIVCLGGEDHRLIWAAELFRQGYAPKVIVTNVDDAALVMKRRLEGMGVPGDSIMVDSVSRTTGDHPDRIASLPGVDRATQRFLIITDREHSRRAAACFRKGGYARLTLFAGRSSAHQQGPTTVQTWRERTMKIPTLAYEYTALLKYRLQGKI